MAAFTVTKLSPASCFASLTNSLQLKSFEPETPRFWSHWTRWLTLEDFMTRPETATIITRMALPKCLVMASLLSSAVLAWSTRCLIELLMLLWITCLILCYLRAFFSFVLYNANAFPIWGCSKSLVLLLPPH